MEPITPIISQIEFPKFTGIRCSMMPFIQGDSTSLPEPYRPYSDIINTQFLEKGEIGFLTIHESFVQANTSQRGYNSKGITRNVHIEVGRHEQLNCWGGGGGTATWGGGGGTSSWGGGSSWGGKSKTILDDSTMVLIANSISGTCRLWNTKEMGYTLDGDLSEYIDKYPEHTGIILKSGEVAKISIFTPHECIAQKYSAERQFFRIVGKGVTGREDYFTINPLIN